VTAVWLAGADARFWLAAGKRPPDRCGRPRARGRGCKRIELDTTADSDIASIARIRHATVGPGRWEGPTFENEGQHPDRAAFQKCAKGCITLRKLMSADTSN
jgi:hypothetical protein